MKTLLLFLCVAAHAQSTDVFVMVGSDFVRPGLLPRVNLNIGAGHTFACLKRFPIGDEVTLAYTYENAGAHGFWHTDAGSHTEALGLMRNFTTRSPQLTWFTWPQVGLTTFTGARLQTHLYIGLGGGAIIHFSPKYSLWIQGNWSIIPSTPGYATASIGLARSF